MIRLARASSPPSDRYALHRPQPGIITKRRLIVPRLNLAATHKHGDAHLPFQRVRPSDPAWPDSANWEALNKAVGGHLIKVQPLVGACTNAAAPGDACGAELESLKIPILSAINQRGGNGRPVGSMPG